jgi:uncharacterized protein
MSDATARGRFVWHELLTTDPKAALDFYPQVIGWKAQAWTQDASYMMFTAKPGPVAGVMLLPEEARAMGAPPNWMIYIGTPDVDGTTREAVELGGKVLRAPESIPNVGRFSVLRDPQGAVFGAFTPEQAPGEMSKPGLLDFSWHELMTTNWQAALAFYQRLFGWEKTEAMDMGPDMGTYQMYGWKGITLGGMMNKPASMAAPPHWLPYALVPDSKRAAALAEKLGGRILNGPMEVPGGDWVAQCVDPQGAVFAVHSRKPAEPKPAAAKPAAKKAAARPAAAKKKTPKKKAAKKAVAKKRPVKRTARKTAAKKRAVRRPARRKTSRRPAARKKGGARRTRRR